MEPKITLLQEYESELLDRSTFSQSRGEPLSVIARSVIPSEMCLGQLA